MVRTTLLGATIAIAVCAASVSAQSIKGPTPQQPDYSKVQETSVALGHGLYMIQGLGGNTTLAARVDGLIVVDTQFEPLYPKLRAKIRDISPLPVRYVINTHYHGDHVGGNGGFAKEGATLVGQRNLVKRMRSPPPNPDGSPTSAMPADSIPSKTYEQQLTLGVNGQTALLTHIPKAHTDGETVVYFKEANVLFAAADRRARAPDCGLKRL